jgi:FMN phosphatase YigB (HAD superfamily)
MKVGFDLDGVWYRFTKQIHLWMNQSAGMSLDLEAEAHSWTWFEDWQTRAQFLQVMHDAVDAKHLFWQGEMYEPQIPQNLRDLRNAGHTIHIVTHRFSGNKECPKQATKYWIGNNDLIFDTLTFSADKASVETDFFIEDNLDNYDALDAAGVQVYLINRLYNLRNDTRRRVNSVDQFTKIVLESAHVTC